MSRNKSNTENQRVKRRLRSRSRRKLKQMLSRTNGFGKCHWCDRIVVQKQSLDPSIIIRFTESQVTWQSTEGIVTNFRATADHLLALADGGKNGSNIVPSCYDCNYNRKSEFGRKLEAESKSKKDAENEMLNWLKKVHAQVSFAKINEIRIFRPSMGPGNIPPEIIVQHPDFEEAFNEAKRQYEEHFKNLSRKTKNAKT